MSHVADQRNVALKRKRKAATGHKIAHAINGLRHKRHSIASGDELLAIAERQVETTNSKAAQVLGRLVWGALPRKNADDLRSELTRLRKLNATLNQDLALLSQRERDVKKHDSQISAYLESQLPGNGKSKGGQGTSSNQAREDKTVLSYVQNHTNLAQTQFHVYMGMSRAMVQHIGSLTMLYSSALEGRKIDRHKLAEVRVGLQNTLLKWPASVIDELHEARQSYARERLPRPVMALLRAANHVEQHRSLERLSD